MQVAGPRHSDVHAVVLRRSRHVQEAKGVGRAGVVHCSRACVTALGSLCVVCCTQGVLSLRNCEVEIGSNNPALRNIPAFAVKTLDRTYQFCADGTPNYRLWCARRPSQCARPHARACRGSASHTHAHAVAAPVHCGCPG